MPALVLYESMFGNTKAVAEAIAKGLQVYLDVEVLEAGSAPAELNDDVRLLVIGGPTHAFGMTRATTRDDARPRSTPG